MNKLDQQNYKDLLAYLNWFYEKIESNSVPRISPDGARTMRLLDIYRLQEYVKMQLDAIIKNETPLDKYDGPICSTRGNGGIE